MADVWVCGDCRSINSPKQQRCYKCRVPRKTGEMTEAAAAMSTASAQQTRTILAQANRLGARYRPSWPLAALVIPLIAVATALSVAQAGAWTALVAADGQFIDDPARLDRLMTLSAAMLVAFGLALLAWSLWIALVVANVPALTARWPPNSPIGAFLAPWIPLINLKRPYTVVRNVLAIVADGRIAPPFIALAWWVLVLATWFVPSIVVAVRGAELGTLPALALALAVRLALLVPSAVLAIAVVVIVEREQRAALARREVAVMGPEGASV